MGAENCEDGSIREDDADADAIAALVSARFEEIIKKGLLIDTLTLDGGATAAMCTCNLRCMICYH